MAGLNKVILIGNLGKDPEVRHIEGGIAIANFSLATNEVYKDANGNKVENTEWHNVVAWRGLAEVCEKYLRKGTQVYVEGKLKTHSWEKEGIKRYVTEIIADNIIILAGKPTSEGSPYQKETPPSSAERPNQIVAEADDLPF